MVVSIDPCCRRGGLWWRIEGPAAGEDNRREKIEKTQEEEMRGREKKGRPTRFKNRGEAGVRSAGFIKLEKPTLVTPVLSFYKLMKPSLVTPVLGF